MLGASAGRGRSGGSGVPSASPEMRGMSISVLAVLCVSWGLLALHVALFGIGFRV